MTMTIVQAGHVASRRLRNVGRQPWYLVVVLVEPFLWLLFFGGVFRDVVHLPAFRGIKVSYLDYLLPGMVVMTAMINGAWAGENMLSDIDRGILNRMLATPVKRFALVIGPLAQQAVVVVIQGALMLALGVLLGGRPQGGGFGIVMLFVAAVLLASGAGAFSNALALVVRKQESMIATLNLVTLPATFLSTAFMPTGALAPWIAHAASANPINWAVQTARAAMTDHVDWSGVVVGTGKLALFAGAGACTAVLAFRRYARST